ncbi:MAG: hypothetical protein ACI8RE_003298 [Ilumatobacter sp.]|jgi:hypothetical protein
MTLNDSSGTQSSTDSSIGAWLTGRLPADWISEQPADVVVDRDEITITLTVAQPKLADGASDLDLAEAADGRIAGFRDETRDKRVSTAREAEHRFERKVSWGVRVGERTQLFTHVAAPVMTRLRQPERIVLDTLVSASVARSRSDALAWCVRLVGKNTDEWLAELRTAMSTVEEVRAQGPDA